MENIAGITKLQYAICSAISFLAPPVGGVQKHFPEFVGDANFAEIPFTYLTGALRSNPAIGANGLVYSISGNAIRAQVSQENIAELEPLLDVNLVLLATDRNSKVWLLGHKDYPVRLSMQLSWGANFDELNQIPITLEGAQPYAPAIYAPIDYLMQNGEAFTFQNGEPIILN